MIDLTLLQVNKGGNPELVKESQKKRGSSVELVDQVLNLYKEWTSLQFDSDALAKKINAQQKEITALRKAKEDATTQIAAKAELDKELVALKTQAKDKEAEMNKMAGQIGNIVDPQSTISQTEDDNPTLRLFHPEGPNHKGMNMATGGLEFSDKSEGILSHHEVLLRLDAFDPERGAKIAGHRGFFLTEDGVDLNQALINYGLDFLRTKGFKKVMTPFMMRKDMMAKTAQLDQFDEELYNIGGDGDDKYLIATSEQPISAMHADERMDPKSLPIKYAGYSTCFRKEAGAHGKDTWGIFRVHQFEKVEQFCITEPEKSAEMLDQMLDNSEAFYQSLGLPYRVVNIVSGALNNAAAIKYDLEAWFPFQGEYKELVSCSNCTDYQSRGLNVRYGDRKPGEAVQFVHMLNGTLCATERALCCVVENYQTPDGLRIPKVLQPYMQGRDFIPYTKDLPKDTTSAKRK
ncbi:hypothetical protein QFC21_002519 [Naganishia friedmannii]|uniref:Uncharacterized protein n=1 Tax=Naganishia friedmannii TaxID=89922 RepID=A0ACC2VXF1_9TREE|nr:hypothetical protein QFC21_002519 [Naganishia friedmannii]